MTALPVLPAALVRNMSPRDVCPCQYGPSGWCEQGKHGKCARTWGWEGHGKPHPETYVISRRDYAALTPVWRIGKACRWLCPCSCHTEVQPLFPAPPRSPGRPSRSGGNGHIAIASTDLLHRDDEQLPALFDVG